MRYVLNVYVFVVGEAFWKCEEIRYSYFCVQYHDALVEVMMFKN